MATQHQEFRLSKPSHTLSYKIDGTPSDVIAESYMSYLEELHSELLYNATSPCSDDSMAGTLPDMFGCHSKESTSEDDGSCTSADDSLNLSGRSFTGRLNAMWNPVTDEDAVLSRVVESVPSMFHAEPPSADICNALLTCAPHGLDAGILSVTCETVIPTPRVESITVGEEQPRRVHNALERERRGNLRRCFERLRTVLPQLRDNRAHSLQILHEATALIAALQSEEATLEADKAQLLQQNAALAAHVAQLRSKLKPLSG